MQTQQHRTTHRTSYATAGNLALVPAQKPVFTVIEGGASHRESPADELRHAERHNSNPDMLVRYVLASVCIVSVLVGASFVSDALCAATFDRSFAQVQTAQVTVSAGDSLWEIAEAHPVQGRSVSDVMRWIERTNGLKSATLHIGQELVVPAS